jgi:hypothetical protein
MDVNTIKQRSLPIFRKHRIVRAAIFGSATRDEMTEKSDVDFLVELPGDVHGFDYVNLKLDLTDDLQKSLEKEIHVTEYKLIKQSLKNYILSTQMRIL